MITNQKREKPPREITATEQITIPAIAPPGKPVVHGWLGNEVKCVKNRLFKIKALTRTLADSQMFFAVSFTEIDSIIGYVCFHEDNGYYDLGYCFHSDYHGKGYAYEACAAMVDYMAKDEM